VTNPKALIEIVRRRLEVCTSGGNFSPARFGDDFGIRLDVQGDKATAELAAYTPEGAVFLEELATSTRFFDCAERPS